MNKRDAAFMKALRESQIRLRLWPQAASVAGSCARSGATTGRGFVYAPDSRDPSPLMVLAGCSFAVLSALDFVPCDCSVSLTMLMRE